MSWEHVTPPQIVGVLEGDSPAEAMNAWIAFMGAATEVLRWARENPDNGIVEMSASMAERTGASFASMFLFQMLSSVPQNLSVSDGSGSVVDREKTREGIIALFADISVALAVTIDYLSDSEEADAALDRAEMWQQAEALKNSNQLNRAERRRQERRLKKARGAS